MDYNIKAEDGVINKGNLYRLKKCMKKALNGGPIITAFLGGSITQGSLASDSEKCYAYLVYKWWKKKFPAADVSFINAGVGGTTSQYGVARVEDHVLRYRPDFVLTEFAVNDKNDEFFKETYEGLIRRIYKDPCNPAMLLMNNVQYDDGKSAEQMHLAVAKAYEIPMVSMKETIYPLVVSGEIMRRDITPDDLHPNDRGHELVAHVIISFLESVYDDLGRDEEPSYFDNGELPAPITANEYEYSQRYQNRNSDAILEGFIKDPHEQRDVTDTFSGGWTADKTGDKISLNIKGSGIAVQYRRSVSRPVSVARVTVDGDEGSSMLLDGSFDEDWGDCLYMDTVLKHGSNKEHRVEIEIVSTHEDDKVPFYLVSVIGSMGKEAE